MWREKILLVKNSSEQNLVSPSLQLFHICLKNTYLGFQSLKLFGGEKTIPVIYIWMKKISNIAQLFSSKFSQKSFTFRT